MISKLLKIAMIAFVYMPAFLLAKDDAVSKFFDKFSESEGVTFVNFNPGGGMMGGLKGSAKADNKEFKEIMSNLKTVKILSTRLNQNKKDAKKSGPGIQINLYDEALKNLPLDEYEKFLEVKEDGTNVKMFYKNAKDGKVHEFLMLVKENNETSVIWIDGVLNLKDLSKIPTMMGVEKGKK